jgi:hypothetical protein
VIDDIASCPAVAVCPAQVCRRGDGGADPSVPTAGLNAVRHRRVRLSEQPLEPRGPEDTDACGGTLDLTVTSTLARSREDGPVTERIWRECGQRRFNGSCCCVLRPC